jgi:hypothetical protein
MSNTISIDTKNINIDLSKTDLKDFYGYGRTLYNNKICTQLSLTNSNSFILQSTDGIIPLLDILSNKSELITLNINNIKIEFPQNGSYIFGPSIGKYIYVPLNQIYKYNGNDAYVVIDNNKIKIAIVSANAEMLADDIVNSSYVDSYEGLSSIQNLNDFEIAQINNTSKFKSLGTRIFTIRKNINISDKFNEKISNMKKLKNITFNNCILDSNSNILSGFGNCVDIETFIIDNMTFINNNKVKNTIQLAEGLNNKLKLNILSLYKYDFDVTNSKIIINFSNLQNLKELKLDDIIFDDDKLVTTFNNFKSLEKLSLNRCNIRNIERLSNNIKTLTNIKELYLDNNMIDDSKFIYLLDSIKNFKKLQVLSLANNNITDKSIIIFAGILYPNMNLNILTSTTATPYIPEFATSCSNYNCTIEGQKCLAGMYGSNNKNWVCKYDITLNKLQWTETTDIQSSAYATSCSGFDCNVYGQKCLAGMNGSNNKNWVCKYDTTLNKYQWTEFDITKNNINYPYIPLVTLNLSNNMIGNDGIRILSPILSNIKTLLNIYIDNNSFTILPGYIDNINYKPSLTSIPTTGGIITTSRPTTTAIINNFIKISSQIYTPSILNSTNASSTSQTNSYYFNISKYLLFDNSSIYLSGIKDLNKIKTILYDIPTLNNIYLNVSNTNNNILNYIPIINKYAQINITGNNITRDQLYEFYQKLMKVYILQKLPIIIHDVQIDFEIYELSDVNSLVNNPIYKCIKTDNILLLYNNSKTVIIHPVEYITDIQIISINSEERLLKYIYIMNNINSIYNFIFLNNASRGILTDDNYNLLTNAIINTKYLNSFIFLDNYISTIAFKNMISQISKNNKYIEIMDISSNTDINNYKKIQFNSNDVEFIDIISSIINNNKLLINLKLSNCCIDDNCAIILADALNNLNLTRLDLSFNIIGNNGFIALLAKGMYNFNRLEDVHFNNNMIGDDGIIRVIHILNNQPLKIFNINNNNFTDIGKRILMSMEIYRKTLSESELSGFTIIDYNTSSSSSYINNINSDNTYFTTTGVDPKKIIFKFPPLQDSFYQIILNVTNSTQLKIILYDIIKLDRVNLTITSSSIYELLNAIPLSFNYVGINLPQLLIPFDDLKNFFCNFKKIYQYKKNYKTPSGLNIYNGVNNNYPSIGGYNSSNYTPEQNDYLRNFFKQANDCDSTIIPFVRPTLPNTTSSNIRTTTSNNRTTSSNNRTTTSNNRTTTSGTVIEPEIILYEPEIYINMNDIIISYNTKNKPDKQMIKQQMEEYFNKKNIDVVISVNILENEEYEEFEAFTNTSTYYTVKIYVTPVELANIQDTYDSINNNKDEIKTIIKSDGSSSYMMIYIIIGIIILLLLIFAFLKYKRII